MDGAASGCLSERSSFVPRERTRWELSTEVDGGLAQRPPLRMMKEVSGPAPFDDRHNAPDVWREVVSPSGLALVIAIPSVRGVTATITGLETGGKVTTR